MTWAPEKKSRGQSILDFLQSIGAGVGNVADRVDETMFPSQDVESGKSELSARDVLAAQHPPRENRGFGNIAANFFQQGAKRRVVADKLRSERLKEEADLALKKAQAGYYESGSGLRGAQADYYSNKMGVENSLAQTKARLAEVQNAKNENEYQIGLKKMENYARIAEARIQQAEAAMMREQNTAKRDEMRNDIEEQKLALQELRDQATAAYQKAMGAAAQTNAGAAAKNADTRATGELGVKQMDAETRRMNAQSLGSLRSSMENAVKNGSTITLTNNETGETFEMSPSEAMDILNSKSQAAAPIKEAIGVRPEPPLVDKVVGAVTGNEPPPANKPKVEIKRKPVSTRIKAGAGASISQKGPQPSTVKVRVLKPFGPYVTGQIIDVLDNPTLSQYEKDLKVQRVTPNATETSGPVPVR